MIKVLWMGNRAPTNVDLQPYLVVRKHRVLAALEYLIAHNSLYRDVTIDRTSVDN